MTVDKGIFIKNVYYMLTYAFRELRANNYEHIAGETFENIHDLLAAILGRGTAYQLKQGLRREYVECHEALTTLRGKLDINGTMRCRMAQKQRLACEYDNLSEDNLFNQVLKTTMLLLHKHKDVGDEQKKLLRHNLIYFSNVSTINLKTVHWDTMRFDRNSKTYRMLMYVCHFVAQNLLMTTETGHYMMQQFSEERMHTLFEHFVLEYYKQEHPEVTARAEQIDWDIDKAQSDVEHLPIMQTDITLHKGTRTLIIDTKYYGKVFSTFHDKQLLHTSNVYQLHAYLTNYAATHTGPVDGLLLYAKTSEDIPLSDKPDIVRFRDGHRLMYCALDLNQEFSLIRKQLDGLLDYIEPRKQA